MPRLGDETLSRVKHSKRNEVSETPYKLQYD